MDWACVVSFSEASLGTSTHDALHASRRHLVDHSPKRAHLSHRLDEILELHRLHDVGIDTELVAPQQILLFARQNAALDPQAVEAALRVRPDLALVDLGLDLLAEVRTVRRVYEPED